MRWTLAVEDEKLELVEEATQIVLPISGALNPGMADSFFGRPGVLTFTRDASGRVNGFGVSYNGMQNIRFEPID